MTRKLFATGMLLLAMLLSAQASSTLSEVVAARAWFTDAEIEGSIRIVKPRDPLPSAKGSFGKGVKLTRSVPIENPLLRQDTGMIGFWLKPDWDGDDGKTHRILRIGDPEVNGLLVEKSAENMLRFVMASPKKMTASRTDVSGWIAGEWHHVVVSWFSYDGKPLGLPLWIDKVAVDGPIAGGNEFLNPDTMEDTRVWVGDENSQAVMDELIMRNRLETELSKRQIELVYRDYFRTAPYTAVRIDPEPLRVSADRRVVKGSKKQFGLEGMLANEFEDMTDFVVRYGSWGNFDAKPFIKWETSNEEVATVDENGVVTGNSIGRCRLTAEFRGMKDTYDVQVISPEQPDLDLAYVERLPRYASDRVKNSPEPGDTVRSVAHVYNMGYKPVSAGAVVVLELFPDTNHNYRVDRAEERRAEVQTQRIGALEPLEEAVVTFSWTWPEEPVWVRVTVDPRDRVEEICEVNNQRCSLNTARPMRWGYIEGELEKFYEERTINLVGSFSTFDWANAQMERLELMLREAVYPSTSPDGVRDSVRLDMITWKGNMLAGEGKFKDVEKKEDHARKFWDGGWPNHEINHPMALDSGVIHEMGHTMLALPDLYGYPMQQNRIYLRGENDEIYEGGALIPYINEHGELPKPPATTMTPCGVGYSSLMNFCHMWIEESNAGKIQHYASYRGHRFWGSQGCLVPSWENSLVVTDVHDRPLAGAAVYVYHVNHNGIQSAGAKYFHDCPKFMGNTAEDGRYVFSKTTDKDWDDPDTDEVEEGVEVWNPFGRVKTDTAFTPNVWSVEGLLLIKIVSGDQTEFQYLDLPQFNAAYFRNQVEGVYPIRTSLLPSEGVTSLVRKEIPETIREKNLRPVAVVDKDELTVKGGEEFTLDGSKSHDPEGQPLIFHEWQARDGSPDPRTMSGTTYKGTAPKEPCEFRMIFYVNDGSRVSEAANVKINVVEGEGE